MFGLSKKPILIRNCSTQRVKELMMEELGKTSECGRYFEPVADLDEIRAFCKKNGFHARETELKSALVVDLMNDREEGAVRRNADRRPRGRQ